MKNTLFSILRVLISISLLFLLFWLMRDDLKDIGKTLLGANKLILLSGTILNIFIIFLLAVRLLSVFRGQNIRLTIKEAVQLTFMGFFFNNFLPTSVGGDIVKAYYAGHKTGKKLQSYTSVFIDRIIGMFGLGVIASIAVTALIIFGRKFENVTIAWVILIFILGSVFVGFIFWNKKFAKKFKFLTKIIKISHLWDKLREIYNAIHRYREKKGTLFAAFGISLVAQLLSIVMIFLMALCISVRTNILNFLLVVPIAGFASMIPSINGLGVREGAFVYFLRGIITSENAFAISLLWLFQLLIISFIGGLIYLFKGQFKIKSIKEESYA